MSRALVEIESSPWEETMHRFWIPFLTLAAVLAPLPPAQPQSSQVVFGRDGYDYRLSVTLPMEQLDLLIVFAASDSPSRLGRYQVTSGKQGITVLSRATGGEEVTVAFAPAGEPSKLRGTYTRNGKSATHVGTPQEILEFFQGQAARFGTATNAGTRFEDRVLRDSVLRGDMRKSIQQVMAEVRRRKEEEYQRWKAAVDAAMGAAQQSFCSRAGDGCKGGSDLMCSLGMLCDIFAWLGEP
jgi:hypothetical protein